MKHSDLIRILKEHGFELTRQGKHQIWSNGNKHIAVPHNKEVSPGVCFYIMKSIE